MATLTIDRHVESTPGTCGGRPRMAGTRIAVADVAVMHLRLGQSVEEIAARYDVDLAAVYAALAYYHDNQAEIDARSAADAAYVEAFERQNPSLLQSRLRALNGE